MITKAVVEEIISPYQVKVRIPVLDRPSYATLSTKSENLSVATICSLPNCYVNIQVGDIVFVGFEDNTVYKAVILGHLCCEHQSATHIDISVKNLTVKEGASLPSNTAIGEITPQMLHCLSGVTDNLQKQIDSLKEQQQRLLEEVFPG